MMSRRRLRRSLALAREVIEVQEEEIALLKAERREVARVSHQFRNERDRLTDGIRRIEAWERSVVGEVNDFSSLRRIVRPLLDEAEPSLGRPNNNGVADRDG